MEAPQISKSEYDRGSELKAFDDTKAGVKGLVDAGITEIPRIFYQPSLGSEKASNLDDDTKCSIPVIDLEGVYENSYRRREIVERVRYASETWGFFQLVNHGIPVSVLEEMKDGVRRFFEQDNEVRKQYYTRDLMKPVAYTSNFDLYSAPSAN